jgi:hypothetical protein
MEAHSKDLMLTLFSKNIFHSLNEIHLIEKIVFTVKQNSQ